MIFGVPFFARELVKIAERYGVEVTYQHNLVAVDGKAKTAIFEIAGGDKQGQRIEAQRLYLQACSTKDGTYHRQLVAEVRERLQGQATDAQIEAAIAATTCPICGCPITAS